jgi:hypothetical protein
MEAAYLHLSPTEFGRDFRVARALYFRGLTTHTIRATDTLRFSADQHHGRRRDRGRNLRGNASRRPHS